MTTEFMKPGNSFAGKVSPDPDGIPESEFPGNLWGMFPGFGGKYG
jgi:hypothetical protein